VHRTVHILDVISSVSRSSNCTKIIGGMGLRPRPHWESSQYSPDHLLGLRGLLLRALLLSGGEGKEGAPETIAPPLFQRAMYFFCSESSVVSVPLLVSTVFQHTTRLNVFVLLVNGTRSARQQHCLHPAAMVISSI